MEIEAPEVSEILPLPSDPANVTIVKSRMNKFAHNSLIWSFADLYDYKLVDGQRRISFWSLDKIFDMERIKDSRYEFRKDFLRSEENFEMRCILCSFKCNYYLKSKSCSEMLDHIRDKHVDVVGEQEIKKRKEYCSFSKNKDKEIEKCHCELTAFVITSFSSFEIVENKHLRNLLFTLNPHYEMPSRTTLQTTMLNTFYERAVSCVKDKIRCAQNISSSLDGWTCKYTSKHFFGFTVHFIENSNLVSYAIRLHEFSEGHGAKEISEFIDETENLWGLKKFGNMLIQTDCAPDVLSAVRNSENTSFGCSCHRLDKIIQHAIEKTPACQRLTTKVQCVCAKIRKTPSLNHTLENVQIEHFGGPLKVLLSVKTRFYSQLLMMKRTSLIRDEIDGVVEAFAEENFSEEFCQAYKKQFTFTDTEYDLMVFICDIFEVLYKKSCRLSSDSEPTLSDVIPIMKSILKWLTFKKTEIRDSEESYIEITSTLFIGDERFTNISEYDELVKMKRAGTRIEAKEHEEKIQEIKQCLIQNAINEMNVQFFGENNILDSELAIMATFLNPKYRYVYFTEKEKRVVERIFKEEKDKENDVEQTQNEMTGTIDVETDIMED